MVGPEGRGRDPRRPARGQDRDGIERGARLGEFVAIRRDGGGRLVAGRMRGTGAAAARHDAGRPAAGLPDRRAAVGCSGLRLLERQPGAVHRGGDRPRRGVHPGPRACAPAARPDGGDAAGRARTPGGDRRTARRRHRPDAARHRLRARGAGDRRRSARRDPGLGRGVRRRRQSLPGDDGRAAPRIPAVRHCAGALDHR